MKEPVQVRHGKRISYDGPDYEWLYHQYVELNKSTVDISTEFGMSRFAVARWIKQYGVEKTQEQIWQNHAERMSGNGNPAWKGGVSRNYQVGLMNGNDREKVCEWCGRTEDVQVHHRDHNTENGDPDNLAYLCYHCNLIEAHVWGLEQKGYITSQMEDNRLTICFRRE